MKIGGSGSGSAVSNMYFVFYEEPGRNFCGLGYKDKDDLVGKYRAVLTHNISSPQIELYKIEDNGKQVRVQYETTPSVLVGVDTQDPAIIFLGKWSQVRCPLIYAVRNLI